MTATEPARIYLVFTLEARDGTETRLVSVRPETPEAAEGIRARVARAKAAWGARHSVGIGLAPEQEEGKS
jgi:hypothetical protein